MSIVRMILFIVISCSLVTACTTPKALRERALYFRDINDSVLQQRALEYEPILQKGDILSIGVITANESSAKMFNQANSYGATGSSSETGSSITGSSQGYLVNDKGLIIFPYLGQIRAAGLSRTALADTIVGRLSKYIDSAIVSIRLLNYRITILGEVTRPGTYSIPSERVSILDAIGLAGDLTIYGQRKNIRIIRNIDGVRQTGLLDLNTGDIFGSPFFYLRQNDIVYVEMNDRKIPNSDQSSLRNVSIGLGILSAIGVIISTINVLR